MNHMQTELEFENKRLEQTVSLAEEQLERAKQRNEDNKSAIIEAKKEIRENTSHAISNLSSSQDFEALAELSQYLDPVNEKIADYEEVENKILILENLIQSPYFARIDFKFEDEDEFEKIYIGRASLKDQKSHEMYIYDWRSPIAGVFYRFVAGPAFYDAPGGRIRGEVALKRQYEIKKGILEYFFDADVQITDEFLRKLLSQNTSPKMKTIVETIQKEQDMVIRDMENDLMMVQGVAGSGKTSIALHRAAYLMYQGLSNKLAAHNIIIISPNPLFEQYISNVLPELGESNVVSVVFEEIVSEILQRGHIQPRNEFLENLITANSSKYRSVIKSSMEFKMSQNFAELLNRFICDMPRRWIPFEDICFEGECIVSGETLKERVLARPEVPLGMKLAQLEEFVVEAIRESDKLHMNRDEEVLVINEMRKFTDLRLINLYKTLFADKEYFYSLAEGIERTDNMDRIIRYTRENLDSGKLYYDDAAALTYLKLKIYGTGKYKNIKQVVIDEAQDYYPLQYEIFNLLFPSAKYTVLGDMNQTLEKEEDLSLYDQIKKILNKKKSSLIILDKSFRCTNEILQYGLKFIGHRTEIRSFNRSGDAPEVYRAADQEDLNRMILSEVEKCLEQGYGSIGLICKNGRNAARLFEQLKDRIELQLIGSESMTDLQGAFIIPVYLSKGMEFDAVLVCDADCGNYYSEDDKKLLYIACTRALHRLNLFCKGEASPLL
ncbi:MAG: AAA family ATPase [Clostridiaceae bacterium]|nr:AAA family ATPase [Clostridiaceae bacterium]